MVLIVERRETPSPPVASEPAPRSTERALAHMHWFFLPDDASPLLRRRPMPLTSLPSAPEAP